MLVEASEAKFDAKVGAVEEETRWGGSDHGIHHVMGLEGIVSIVETLDRCCFFAYLK